MFGIWCEVWGGVTGSRRSWLKADGENPTVWREQAEAEAARLAQDRNSNPHRTATFNYTVRRLLKVA